MSEHRRSPRRRQRCEGAQRLRRGQPAKPGGQIDRMGRLDEGVRRFGRGVSRRRRPLPDSFHSYPFPARLSAARGLPLSLYYKRETKGRIVHFCTVPGRPVVDPCASSAPKFSPSPACGSRASSPASAPLAREGPRARGRKKHSTAARSSTRPPAMIRRPAQPPVAQPPHSALKASK